MKLTEQGFSMIEVLVTTVILAVGLLGIAALQVTTSMYTASSLYRSQAAALSREIIERMRGNLDSARAGDYDFTTLPSYTTDCNGMTANCTGSEVREHDLRLWAARVSSILPAGEAAIATTPDPPAANRPSQVTITLQWDESQGERVDEVDAVVMVEQQFVFEIFGFDT